MRRALNRGQAITEFALVLPVLIVILLYSMYFTELVRAKLKLQEASRYVAWEMTSYTLDDYGKEDHNKAFATARDSSVLDGKTKFADLDSIDTKPAGGFVAGYSNVTVKITNHDAPLITNPIAAVGGGNSFINNLLSVLNGSADAAFNHFGFNTRGKVQVEVSMQLDNRLLPQHFLDENDGFFKADVFGGRNLQNLTMKNRFTLLASGWDLPDGADAEQHRSGPGGPRSGVHRGGSDQGLYTQVSRMSLLGAPEKLGSIPGFNTIMGLIGNFVPNPITATYVVSHNYFAARESGIRDRDCDDDPSHGAQWGMNNLDGRTRRDGPGLDYEKRKCFDTAPFRDTSRYDESQYRSIYMARGPYFMGCKKAQADNPSEGGPPEHSAKDKHNKKYNCEGP
jgi:Flp pilus assembly protein TadG